MLTASEVKTANCLPNPRFRKQPGCRQHVSRYATLEYGPLVPSFWEDIEFPRALEFMTLRKIERLKPLASLGLHAES